jgi:hypothetical protein
MMKPARSNFSRTKLTVPFLLVAVFAGCKKSHGGGGIPLVILESEAPGDTGVNDTPATADTVRVGTPVSGNDDTPGDVDCFKMHLSGGRVIEIELFGTRNEQTAWDTDGTVPRVTLLDTDANANAKLLEHDYSGNFSDGWSWGAHDLDMPMFEVPATGDYYVAVTQDDQTVQGGRYVLRVHYLSVPNLQEEAEPTATSGVNDTFGTAQAITPGTIHGFHVAGEDDFYSFTVSGPSIVRFEMTAYRNGVNRGTAFYYDTYIYLYDQDGVTQLTSDDDSYFYDSSIQYKFDTAGTYFLRVFEFDTADSEYFLSYKRTSASAPDENESNDTTATANSIAYGGRVNGDIDVGDVDYFKFTGKKGDMVRLQYFDSSNAQGKVDDVNVSLIGIDEVTALGTGGDGDFQTLTTILQDTGTFFIKVDPVGGATTYTLELTRFKAATPEVEPNDTIAAPNILSRRTAGVIDIGVGIADADVYRVSLVKNRLYTVVCYASNGPTGSDGDFEYSGHGSDCAPLIEVLDDTGTVVGSSSSDPFVAYTESVTDPLPTCAISGYVDVSGTYFIRVTDALGGNGPTFYYELEKR